MPDVSISDAEWQVMHVIWDGQPLTAQEVVAALQQTQTWASPTIKTMLHRLVGKGALAYAEDGNRYVYRACVRRADCVKQAGRSFLQRVFAGESSSLVAHFLKHSRLSSDDIARLRRILDEQEAQS